MGGQQPDVKDLRQGEHGELLMTGELGHLLFLGRFLFCGAMSRIFRDTHAYVYLVQISFLDLYCALLQAFMERYFSARS